MNLVKVRKITRWNSWRKYFAKREINLNSTDYHFQGGEVIKFCSCPPLIEGYFKVTSVDGERVHFKECNIFQKFKFQVKNLVRKIREVIE